VSARVALVSARGARDLDEDLPPLVAAFAEQGAQAQVTVWDDPQVQWSGFDVALLRSAWDYTERIGEFLAWAARTAAVTRLLNPLPVVRWNSDKHYLQDLAQLGVPIVASEFVEVDMDPQAQLERFLARYDSPELVVKPAVGAGSRDARRHARTAHAEILGHMRPLLAAGRSLLVQPYLPSVDHSGETALVYIEGAFSHAFRKGPLLPLGAGSTAALFAAEEITARVPGADELAVGAQILAGIAFKDLLYARIDLIRGPHHQPQVLELELTEPSLYFQHGAGSAARLAQATLARLTGRARRSAGG
jgi:O-ureido-D-serine cyclo-ligase